MTNNYNKLKRFGLGLTIPIVALFFILPNQNSANISSAELVEALSLISSIKSSVAEYYMHTGNLPNSNSEAKLPPPEALFGRNVKQVSILAGGIIRADFHEEPGKLALQFFPIPHLPTGRIDWECGSDTIPGRVLVQLKGMCKYLPLTLENKLVRAVERGDLESVQKYLESGAKIDAISDGTTALMLSVVKGNPEVAEELLRQGALVDYVPPSANGMSPLIVAVKNNQTDIAKILIDHGASISKTDKKHKTALYYAQENLKRSGDSELFNLLTQMETAANEVSGSIASPAGNLHVDYSNLLASIESCDHKEFQRLFTSDETLTAGTIIGGLTLFSRTIRSECLKTVEIILQRTTFQPETSASLLIEALKYAPQSHRLDTLKLLINANAASVNGQDASGATPLMTALALKYHESAEFLLNHQADPNQSGTSGSFPIIESCNENFDAVTKLLIAKGAKVNIQDLKGRTALMAAVEHRNSPIVELLLENGASPYLRDKQDVDAILIAESKGYTDILNTLRKSAIQ